MYNRNPNRPNISFDYFIKQPDNTLIGGAHDEECNAYTYIIYVDGDVRWRRNEGIWHDLNIMDAAHIRYVAGKFLKRPVASAPAIFRTSHILA